MKNWQIAALSAGAVALLSGIFWAAMAIAAEDGLKKLDLDWFGPVVKAGDGAAAQPPAEEAAAEV